MRDQTRVVLTVRPDAPKSRTIKARPSSLGFKAVTRTSVEEVRSNGPDSGGVSLRDEVTRSGWLKPSRLKRRSLGIDRVDK